MEHHGIYVVFLLFFTVIVVCFGAESQAMDPKSRIEPKSTPPLNTSSDIVKQSEKKPILPDQKDKIVKSVSAAQDGTKNVPGTGNSSKDMDIKEVPKVGNDKDHSSDKSHLKEGDIQDGTSDGSKSKMVPKGVSTEGNSVLLTPPKKDGARGEECYSSNTCKVEKDKLVACLRVPGNDSPEFSLLIQNKGTSPLKIDISAPDSVHLENNSVQIPENQDQKVKVTIGMDNKSTLIFLTAVSGNCSIDFRDLIPQKSGEKPNDTVGSTNIMTKNPWVLLIFILGPILVASSYMCFTCWRKHQSNNGGSKYQKLETELPISDIGGKKETDVEEGWEDSWGDSWDDEEAPKTPSMPITPSLSSKGLASRKLGKDSWKD